ncbi:uncharacterized protein EV420DRAFT_1074659 [Desarmillaria tabescens]|uniref:Uncharacterized protein n=1 Tax=Armillaria tabescens TaxID=1929756 RepID=A0AA39JH74_ARMTA|nr:uncharacterized protein EV420DRAFT_1074659 [Desarmillaria tabescens]KAK0442717.1 hypothetical protein EV420DRAFT_1074659 [Desarmillaria tabescens]
MMSSSDRFNYEPADFESGFNFGSKTSITSAIDSLPPNINGPPPASFVDVQCHFRILDQAVRTFQRWKAANENMGAFGDIVISPMTRQYISVDDAIRKINDEVPREFRIEKPPVISHVTNGPARVTKADWKLLKNGDVDALVKRWSSEELQVREPARRDDVRCN